MGSIKNSSDLKFAIHVLTLKKEEDWNNVKEQFQDSIEQLKPMNIIKNEFKEFVSSPTLKHDLVNAGIEIVTGYLAKKVLVGETNNPLSKVFGFITEFVVANQVSKNADGIKSFGSNLLQKIFPAKIHEEIENE